jgi:hypothetical protein
LRWFVECKLQKAGFLQIEIGMNTIKLGPLGSSNFAVLAALSVVNARPKVFQTVRKFENPWFPRG